MPVSSKILSVIAPHSGSGKTLFVTRLLRHIRGLGCLKVRPSRAAVSGIPPPSQESSGNFAFKDPAALRDPGSDTAAYFAAGAAHVEILRCSVHCLKDGLAAALQRFPDGQPLIVESSSAVRELNPVAVVLIVRLPLREMKPSTNAVLGRVTDLYVNADEFASPSSAAELCTEFPELRPSFIWQADLLNSPLPARLTERLRSLLQPSNRLSLSS